MLSRAHIPSAQQYFIRILTEKYVPAAHNLFKQEFATGEPLWTSYIKRNPQANLREYHNYWDTLGRNYYEKVFKSGLSIACFDQRNPEQLVGVVLVKDNKLENEADRQSPIGHAGAGLINKMIAKLDPYYQELLQSNEVRAIEQCHGVVKKEHYGRGLFTSMLAAGDFVGRKHNYQYSLGWASNFKTGLALKRLGYNKIGEIDVKEYSYEGVKYFELIEEESRLQSLWIKDIRNIEENSMPIKIVY